MRRSVLLDPLLDRVYDECRWVLKVYARHSKCEKFSARLSFCGMNVVETLRVVLCIVQKEVRPFALLV